MRIFLLGNAHPVVRLPFMYRGVYKETVLRRGCDYEGGGDLPHLATSKHT